MFGLIVGLSKNIGRNNMKRKKILALLMVAALCVGTVAGCGSKDTESSKSESGKEMKTARAVLGTVRMICHL